MLVAVVDTNVWISAFLTPHGHPAQIYSAAKSQLFFPLTSEPLRAELAEVLSRPRLMKTHGESLREIDDFVSGLKRLSILVPVTGTLALCRDPDDDVLLETALAGHAPYIVSRNGDLTRDLDLHEAATRLGIQIATVAQFLQQLT
ncbi:MAG TPA: putative toxin-antitoxin system toxin component, PIN family [Anaerolineae bacterium]|nr:putative toxin-antitoxin system toxin component, PIN family [Anaerolineae bacterium]